MSRETKVIDTLCIACVWSCGIKAYVEDGRLVKVEGLAEHPLSRGLLCPRGKALVDWVYSPHRLRYPLKKDVGGWKRISWDEALDTITENLLRIRDRDGAHALAIFCGSIGVENNELAAFARRFRGAYGTPNFLSVESVCYRSRILAHQLTFGTFLLEEPQSAKCVILWGTDPDNSRPPLAAALREEDKQLIVINPKRIELAKTGLHVPIRPGSDCALALGMINTIIEEGLYDQEFVKNHTIGFDRLREHARRFPPEKVQKVTGVRADEIRRIAKVFATTKPACIVQGTCSLDQRPDGVQTTRALTILQAITGNVDVPGGWAFVPFPRLGSLHIKVEENPIGATEHPLFHRLWGRQSPYGQAMYFLRAVLEEKPYPIKALIVSGGNPALSLPDSQGMRKALEKLDFTVVMDPFMTETARFADIVLPACTFLERDGIGYVYAVTSGLPYLVLRKKVIEPVGESWPDWKFWCELSRRMGYGKLFPWRSEDEIIDHWLQPMNLTREEVSRGVFFAQKTYDTLKKGRLRTPSGKIELYSETLEEYGYDPLPVPWEASLSEEYPLWLSTGARNLQYTHTQFKNIPSLRQQLPEPVAEVHPFTAEQYGLTDGDFVLVETPNGQIRIRLRTTEDLMPDVVSIPHGWTEANVNELTGSSPLDPISGYPQLKALRCRISRG